MYVDFFVYSKYMVRLVTRAAYVALRDGNSQISRKR